MQIFLFKTLQSVSRDYKQVYNAPPLFLSATDAKPARASSLYTLS